MQVPDEMVAMGARRIERAPEGTPADGAFVGRRRELRRLRSLLRKARLVTLVGPGGVGKTRLALELVAGGQAGHATVVRLDECVDAPGAEIPDDLEGRLAAGRHLIVFDSAEHVVDSCATVVYSLLRRCPDVRIVVTSREALRVPGEVIYRVGGLAVPAAGEQRRSAVLRSDAVRLFVETARTLTPGFAIRPDEVGAVAELCRRLEGLPLAIELAAHRVGTTPVAALVEGLDDPLALLTDQADVRPDRHRCLGATIEWSYRLLDPAQRTVFRRLAVLPGGFCLDAARAVSAFGDIEPGAVLAHLCALDAKSLIERASGETDDGVRFRQPDGTRAFALDRLAAAGELDECRERADAWLATQAEALCQAALLPAVAPPLRPELDNLAAALDHHGNGHGDRRVLLALALAQVRWQQRRAKAARNLLRRALDLGRRSGYRGEAMIWSALATCVHGDYDGALRLAEQAVRIERGHKRPAGLAKALDALAYVRLCRGDLPEAERTYRECLEVVRPSGSALDIAKGQSCLAWTLLMEGQVDEAEGLLAEAMPVYRALAEPPSRVTALNALGALQLSTGDLDAAEESFAEVLRTVPPNDYCGSHAVDGLAIVAAGHADARRAVCLATAATVARQRGELVVGSPWRGWVNGAVGRARRTLSRGETNAAISLGRQLDTDRLREYALREANSMRASRCPGGPLTRREADIAALVVEGLTNQEIADRLNLSMSTVRTHIASIHNKLDVRSRTQIAVWTVRQPGLLGSHGP